MFCLISLGVSYYVSHFPLVWLFFPSRDSCCWHFMPFLVPYFFSSYFFISFFTPILLHKRIWAFVGQIMLTRSKGSWAQFVFIWRSHFTRELYYAVDLYFAADLHFAIVLYTKGFEKGFGPNLSLFAKAILPGNCILWQICILLQICVLL